MSPRWARGASAFSRVARSLPREVDPLSQLGFQDCADVSVTSSRSVISVAVPSTRWLLSLVFTTCISPSSCSCRFIPVSETGPTRVRCEKRVIALVLSLGFAGSGAQHEAALDGEQQRIRHRCSVARYFVNYCLGCHSAVRALQRVAGITDQRAAITKPDVHGRQPLTRWRMRCGGGLRALVRLAAPDR